MKITTIFPVLNQFEISIQSIRCILENSEVTTNILVLDNDSDIPFTSVLNSAFSKEENERIEVCRYSEPLGSYPAIFEGRKHCDSDILAFFHSDFFVLEKGWDKRVIEQFEKDTGLGMIGFVSSNQLDTAGGRGLGTVSNFMGKTIGVWTGSKAEVHGGRDTGFRYTAISDGCAMIFRKTVLDNISFRKDIALHHFYDKILSVQVLELGYKNGYLGIECDHISGQTASTQSKYFETSKKWFKDNHIMARSLEPINWDNENYWLNEDIFLTEFGREKKMIPMTVDIKTGNRIV